MAARVDTVEAGAGTARPGADRAVAAGTVAWAGTTTAAISAGTSTDGAVRDGADLSLRPTAGMDGAAQDLSERGGRIGATPWDGAGSAGGGGLVHGPGAASWSVPRLASSSPHR